MQITNISKNEHEYRRLDKRSKTRIFVWPQGETILENLQNRRSRPYTLLKPIALRAAEAMGVTVDKLSWSQNAGCKCGCSPGFVVKGDHRPGFDIHVDVAEHGANVVSLAEARMNQE